MTIDQARGPRGGAGARVWNRAPIRSRGADAADLIGGDLSVVTPKDLRTFTVVFTGARFGTVDVVHVQASTFSTVRDKRLSDETPDSFYLSVVLQGSQRTSHAGQDAHLRPGAMVLTKNDMPLVGQIAGPYESINVGVSASTMNGWGLRTQKLLGRRLGTTSLMAGLGSFLKTISYTGDPDDPVINRLVELALRDLIHASLYELSGSRRSLPPSGQSVRVLTEQLIARDYANPDLDTATIAERLGIGVRTLHRSFAATGENTVAAALRDHRLAVAAAILSASPRVPVDDIAATIGFNGATQFRRAFKQKFDMSPSEFRHRS